jgi:hypothetical protein
MPFKYLNTKILFLALGASALAGCQFGNRDVTTLTGYDTISGYYSSLPQSIAFHAEIGTGAPRDQPGLVNQMPDFIKTVMGNPVMLYFDDPIGGAASLRSHSDTTTGIGTMITSTTSTFGASSTAYADVSGCRFQQAITNSGKFSQSPTTSTIAGLNVRGKISLDYTITYSFIGDDIDCNAVRANFQSCFQTGTTGCSTDSASIFYPAFVKEVFGPFVNAGVMTDTEIGSTRGISYHAVYQ